MANTGIEPVEHAEHVEHGKHDMEGRRRALIEAATNVFAECGYDCATTRVVAERAGCAEGLIHRYFGGKQGLLIAILENKAGALAELYRTGLPDGDSVAEEVEQLLLRALEMMWEQQCFMRVSVSRGVIDPEVGRTITARLTHERVRLIAEKLQRHQAAGRIPLAVDLEAAAETITGLAFAFGFMEQVVMQIDRGQVRRMALGAAALLAAGLTAPRNTPARGAHSVGDG